MNSPTTPPYRHKPLGIAQARRAGAPAHNDHARLPEGEALSATIPSVRVQPKEKAAFLTAAHTTSLSWWIRDTLRRAAGLPALPRKD